jgi:hypothetical protein
MYQQIIKQKRVLSLDNGYPIRDIKKANYLLTESKDLRR